MSEPEAPESVQVFNVLNHQLVPHHEVLSEDDRKAVLKRYNITLDQLPKILTSDPAAKACGARMGDIVRVVRDSPTAGRAIAYRYVVEFS